MVHEIIWTNEASKNLKEISDYISKDSIYYARRNTEHIYKKVETLSTYPEIGMLLPIDFPYALRRILVKSYRVIYCFEKHKIYVLAVYRQGRLLPQDFDFALNYLS